MRTRLWMGLLVCLGLLALPAAGQSGKQLLPPALEKELASKASESSEVTLDKKMLAFASKFMNSKDPDEAQALQLIQKLDYVYVRSYEFKKSNMYKAEDVDRIRKQFENAEWFPMIRERSSEDGESTDLYVHMVNGEMHGMVILNAEAEELTLVYILGTIHPEDLEHLGGNFGIPKHAAKAASKKMTQGAK